MFNFQKSISNLVNIDGEINIIIEKCKPKTKIEYDKIRVASILNEIRKSMLDFFFMFIMILFSSRPKNITLKD